MCIRDRSLHRGLCADRHEHGGFDDAVRRVQQSGPRAGDRAFGLNLEGEFTCGQSVPAGSGGIESGELRQKLDLILLHLGPDGAEFGLHHIL